MNNIRTGHTKWAAILCNLFLSVSAADELPKAVSLHVDRDGSFEVLHSRATSTATSAVFFGLIGAAVTGGQESGEDREREAQLLPLFADATCRETFTTAFAHRLREKQVALLAPRPEESVAPEIWVRIDACGFKLMDPDSGDLAAFFAAEYAILDAPARDTPRDRSRLLMIGRQRQTWEELTANGELAASLFDNVKVRAGRRLANKVIYDNN